MPVSASYSCEFFFYWFRLGGIDQTFAAKLEMTF
jgi:hypothetical protein